MFFFQAEDGIRYYKVTGVQTCALPIYQEVPASVDGVSAEQMQERGDYALVDAVTRTVGLTASSTPGNGGLAFSSRGFAGVNSVGVAEDGMVLGVARSEEHTSELQSPCNLVCR